MSSENKPLNSSGHIAGTKAPGHADLTLQRLPPTGTVVGISTTDRVGRIVGRAVSCGNVVAVIDLFGEDRTVIAGAGEVTTLPTGPRLVAVNGRTVAPGRPAAAGRENRAC